MSVPFSKISTLSTSMDSKATNSPVFLVFPPEVADPEYQSTELRGRTYEYRNSFQKLFTTKMKILGATQIILGILNFSFGIVFVFTLVKPYPRFPFILISGYPFWGSALFILSGAFLIALKRKTTETMIRANCIVNFLSILGALVGIILLSFGLLLDGNYLCGYSQDPGPSQAVTVLFMFKRRDLFVGCTCSPRPANSKPRPQEEEAGRGKRSGIREPNALPGHPGAHLCS
ncbi:membrane-spanning 4-domains subfamily A member 5-like [Fukomys damarensis]|uniref:membrane-spanning 4-domains subfamily A member 5-like n=1 Tax=Fukomys damarensis TaxID=885580 RepID=UPI00053FD26F|nr:membrane-spanning 4-domains subfamily A member 5-like [Fukomys damarensis]